MNSIEAVIFDFGGVLIDWNPYYLYRKVMTNDTEIERFLQEIDFKNWNYTFDQGEPFAHGVSEACQKFPQRAELIRMYDERWLETIGVLFNANIELLARVKTKGIPVYGLSNWSAEKFSLVRPQHNFFTLFDDIVISGEVKLAKPDPRIFQLLLERNHLHAQNSLYIDDVEENLRTARNLGLQTIHYRSSGLLERDLAERGVI